jgi:Ca-activated chloride channel family protein
MDLLWPGYLFLLLLIPLLILGYIWVLRRRRRYAVRFSSLSLIRAALPRQSSLRRHIPFALFLLALASLMVAAARPVAITTVPADQTTIILSMDVSGSMRFTDIAPSRLGAAEAAAISFIKRQKASMQIGLVAFSGYAELIQEPTTDQDALQSAIQSLTTGRRTAIGSGILKALEAIAEINQNVAPIVSETSANDLVTPVPNGAYVPEIIVLLTDGVANAGPAPLDAAKQAADRGVRVYTIGFGTESGPQGGSPFGSNPQSPDGGFGSGGQQSPNGGSGNNNFFQGGRGFRRGIDEDTMKQIADLTGGEYYAASNSDELNNVFKSLPTHLITKHETTEISALFAALGGLITLAAVLLSFRFHPLP